MYEIIDNHVFRVHEIVTPTQQVIVKTFYDLLYHTDLTYDPARGKVRAEVRDYQGNPVPTFTDPITFELDKQTITVNPVNGIAEIDFSTELPGEYTIRTVNPSIRNGEVTIRV